MPTQDPKNLKNSILTGLYNKLVGNRIAQSFIRAKVIKPPEVSKGFSQEEMDTALGAGIFTPGEFNNNFINFRQAFDNKRQRVAFYRDMSIFSEISDSLDNVCDEAITEDVEGNIVNINFASGVPKNLQKRIYKEFDYVMTDVFKVHEKGWDLFRKFIVEGELYLEAVLNNDGKSLQGIKILPSYTVMPVYEGNEIKKYFQFLISSDAVNKNSSNANTGITYTQQSNFSEPDITFETNQVLYVNYGEYGRNLIDIRGYLEPSIRPYNQLKNIEDAVVCYRLQRGTERRIFNISTGRMTKAKSEEYLRNLISKYKKKMGYNSDTGNMDNSANIMSLNEDFWFAKGEDGKGSTVELLQGGGTLGEITDVLYFLKKLWVTLKMPKSRWQSDPQYTSTTEIARDEIKFYNFIKRLQNRFKKVFNDALMLQLQLRGGFEDVTDKMFDISLVTNNPFAEKKNQEMRSAQLDMIGKASDMIMTPETPTKGVFSREFIMKRFVGLSDQDYDENEELRAEEILKFKADFPTEGSELAAQAGLGGAEAGAEGGATGAEGAPEAGAEVGAGAKEETPAEGEAPAEEKPEGPTLPMVPEELVNKELKKKLQNIENYRDNFKRLGTPDEYSA